MVGWPPTFPSEHPWERFHAEYQSIRASPTPGRRLIRCTSGACPRRPAGFFQAFEPWSGPVSCSFRGSPIGWARLPRHQPCGAFARSGIRVLVVEPEAAVAAMAALPGLQAVVLFRPSPSLDQLDQWRALCSQRKLRLLCDVDDLTFVPDLWTKAAGPIGTSCRWPTSSNGANALRLSVRPCWQAMGAGEHRRLGQGGSATEPARLGVAQWLRISAGRSQVMCGGSQERHRRGC